MRCLARPPSAGQRSLTLPALRRALRASSADRSVPEECVAAVQRLREHKACLCWRLVSVAIVTVPSSAAPTGYTVKIGWATMSEVLVVIGVGGMGQAIARRCGAGKTILLADFNEATLHTAADGLMADGHTVEVHAVDVAKPQSMATLAEQAAQLGDVKQIAHTAGLSPVQASADAILAVDLLGVALMLDEFGQAITPGGACVVISSMAGHMLPLPSEQEAALSTTPADGLLGLPFVEEITEPAMAYSVAKRANHIRVQAASVPWGRRGARVNSISPGIISTPMGQQELASPNGALMRSMLKSSGTGRLGTPDDIAAASAFLLGPDASFITGTDLLVDGGVIGAMTTGQFVD
jgi:NAD(P)-dependent dehydrogenase (short-subunit alcohol dehydrogenase family)